MFKQMAIQYDCSPESLMKGGSKLTAVINIALPWELRELLIMESGVLETNKAAYLIDDVDEDLYDMFMAHDSNMLPLKVEAELDISDFTYSVGCEVGYDSNNQPVLDNVIITDLVAHLNDELIDTHSESLEEDNEDLIDAIARIVSNWK